ncbi:hypothetical protein [Sphaerotilus sp.]|uniref:hypothetical protein n=1 Tax=Sphaerotilus sp. TaxID=2093942 RepID=UPI002ACE1804|nr:hypothetical protein [Sphaerotilus sp.]MDZ7858189.1 hypothetical protein [Sphaerotilus sp.]
MNLQLCVRDPAEAARAVRAGAAGVEVMSPAPEVIRAVVTRLRLLRDGVVVGAGIGPLAALTPSAVRLRVRLVADCGVDRVRVPVPAPARPSSVLLLTQLGQLAREGVPVTPMLRVPLDRGDGAAWVQRLSLVTQLGFASVLLDARGTDAQGADLWQQRVSPGRLLGAFDGLRRMGVQVGLMAAPRRAHLRQLLHWAPDEVVLDCGREDPREGRVVDAYQFDQWVAELNAHQAMALDRDHRPGRWA